MKTLLKSYPKTISVFYRLPFILFLSLTFFLPCHDLFAQKEVSLGGTYYGKAKGFVRSNVDSFYHYIDLSKEAYKNENDWGGIYNCEKAKWNLYRRNRDLDSAKIQSLYLLDFAKSKFDQRVDSLSFIADAHGIIGLGLSENGFYKKSIEEYQTSLQYMDELVPYLDTLMHSIGPSPASEILQDSLRKLEKTKFNSQFRISTLLNNLAKVHADQGDYEQARSTYGRSLKMLPPGLPASFRGTIINNIAYLHLKQEEYEEAKTLLLQALPLLQEYKEVSARRRPNLAENYTNTCNNLGFIYLQIKQLDSTAYYLNLAIKTQAEENITRSASLTNLYLGQLALQRGDTEQGTDYLKLGLKKALDYSEIPNTYIARCYFELASAYKTLGNTKEALEYLTKSTEALHRGALVEDLPLKQDSIISEIEMLKVLRAKAQLLWEVYEHQKETEVLEKAFKIYQYIDDLITSTRQSYLEDKSKLFLSEQGHLVYGEAIQVAEQLYRIHQSAEYVEAIFNFMESDKASVLLEALAENEARMFTSLTSKSGGQVLLDRERQLKEEIANYKRLIFESENKFARISDWKKEQWNAALFNRKEQFQELQKQLEQQFPDYYRLKYQPQIATIKNIQQKVIGAREALLEYYMNDEFLAVLVITKDRTEIQFRPVTEENEMAINTYLQQISSFEFDRKPEESFSTFTEAAHRTYNFLLGDLELVQAGQLEHLYIIPDGPINYTPFKPLLTQLPKSGKVDYSPQNLDYLLEDFVFSNAYSASQLYFYEGKVGASGRIAAFAGFAPTFDGDPITGRVTRSCTDGILGPLTENKSEVQQIAAMLGLGSTTFLGQEASSEQFKQVAAKYRILHLATHACSQADSSLYQRIYFGNDDYLYGFELYDLDLNADLVVLSACETGIGELVEGEGVLSLARAFSYAGSPSVLTSLWSISDASASAIMVKYYEHLSTGTSKSSALQQAQIAFLQEESKRHMHPVYWAGFVMTGVDDPISLVESSSWIWLLFIVAGLFAAVFLLRGFGGRR